MEILGDPLALVNSIAALVSLAIDKEYNGLDVPMPTLELILALNAVPPEPTLKSQIGRAHV